MSHVDRYLLRLAFWPMVGATGVTLLALLLERTLRLLDMLSASSDRFGFVAQLAVNLVPHYVGLTLPAAFFLALVIVVNRMNQASEVDALLAAGVSLTRLAAPYLCLAAALTVVSLAVFGFLQPYSRYAYRAVLHTAQNAGWNGLVPAETILLPSKDLTMTTDAADPAGQQLSRIFIRRITDKGREEVTTAGMAEVRRTADGKNVQLKLKNGQQLRYNEQGRPEILSFQDFTMQLPIQGPAKLLRARGGDERELTLFELADQAESGATVIPKATLLAELYGRLARALVLPLLPLLAVPLGMAAKRSGRAPGIIVGGLLLLAFFHLVQLGQGLAETGRVPPEIAVGAPFFGFAAIAFTVFITSRKRPGETPIGRLTEYIGSQAAKVRLKRAGAEVGAPAA
ncbi:LptF/LptG family permease [Phenylobacterium sp.]|uniref:LptF/LptG family permease n=1 Tax=Phenylobacterium sp. TaxID=1871053 RepID=UPI0025CC3D10|nr:LptF/LptG family permease [Phenylobacterium sp.]